MELVLAIILVAAVMAAMAVGLAVGLRRRRPELEARPEAPPEAPPEAIEAPAEAVEAPPEPLVAEPEPVEVEPEPVEVEVEVEPVAPPPPVKPRFRDRLSKARTLFAGYLSSVLSRSGIDDETWDELEEALIRADVGVGLTSALLDDLRSRVRSEGITSPTALVHALKEDLVKKLAQADRSLRFEPGAPNVWLFVGVNGVGKTTTIGKVGLREAAAGRTVVMAAADTFRAAAAEQLEL
ncbi:MAG: signal recognition particle receptor subunit alpha, partial [Actinomycetota bacterium]|nr:signal recognition particle receptor subunit alpha [Actinomycetota bacterium]